MLNNHKSNQEINQELPKENKPLRPDTHSFDTDIAKDYGIEVALMYKHVTYWVNYNKTRKSNFHEGRYWFYNTIDEFAAHFPYWSTKQVERLLKKMFDLQLILKGNYNKTSFDRTIWYTLNCQMHIPKSGNGNPEIGRPIPNTNTNTKVLSKDNTQKPKGFSASDDAQFLFKYFNDMYKKMRESRGLSYKPIAKLKTQINALEQLLKNHSKDYIIKIIDKSLQDDFWYKHVNKPTYLKTKFESLETLLQVKKQSKNTKPINLKEDLENYKKSQSNNRNVT